MGQMNPLTEQLFTVLSHPCYVIRGFIPYLLLIPINPVVEDEVINYFTGFSVVLTIMKPKYFTIMDISSN